MSGFEAQLKDLVISTPWMRCALEAAREVDPPDWLIGAGAVRSLVWDHLHGRARPELPRDIDLAFFDPPFVEPEREASFEAALAAREPQLPWDATNEASVHLWYGERFGVEIEAFASIEDAVASWPETAACVGVRLLQDDEVEVLAPLGLDDLFGLVWRRNPRLVTEREYRRRLTARGVTARWPRARVL